MSDLLELYVRLERDETDGVPTDRRIMAAFAELHPRRHRLPHTPIQIAIVADCEPDESPPRRVDGLRVAARRRRLPACASGGVRVGHGRTSATAEAGRGSIGCGTAAVPPDVSRGERRGVMGVSLKWCAGRRGVSSARLAGPPRWIRTARVYMPIEAVLSPNAATRAALWRFGTAYPWHTTASTRLPPVSWLASEYPGVRAGASMYPRQGPPTLRLHVQGVTAMTDADKQELADLARYLDACRDYDTTIQIEAALASAENSLRVGHDHVERAGDDVRRTALAEA